MEPGADGMRLLGGLDSYYSEFYNSLPGKKPIRFTDAGLWATYPLRVYHELFRRIGLGRYKNFLDLGSGDGKVALLASLFTKSSGVEYDRDLYEKGCQAAERLGLSCRFMNRDFFAHDISSYDIILHNPDKGYHNGIEDKLLAQLKGTLIVCNNIFLPRLLKRGQTLWIESVPFIMYINPNFYK